MKVPRTSVLLFLFLALLSIPSSLLNAQSQNVELVSTTLPELMYTRGVVSSGGKIFLACANGFAIQDSATRRMIGFWSQNVALGRSIAVAGNYAYFTGARYINNSPQYGLFIVDISNPTRPNEVRFYYTPDYAMGLAVSGRYAYVTASSHGLRIIDISSPTSPSEAGYCDTPGNAIEVAVAGNYAYVADATSGLRIINVSNPLNPTEAGSVPNTGYVTSVCVAGNYAYLADWNLGLRVIDVSNPSSPTEVGSLPGFRNFVTVSGQYVYATTGSNMTVIDVSTKTAPTETGSFSFSGNGNGGIAVSGNEAYIADETAGFITVDVSNPAAPVQSGSWFAPYRTQNVNVSDNYAYAVDGNNLHILDISNPFAPSEVGQRKIGTAKEVAVSGTTAYVAAGTFGMRILDVSVPSAPVELGYYLTPGDASGIAVEGSHAYVADGYSGLRIFDVSQSSTPVPIGYVNTPGTAVAVKLAGNYAYVADSDSGFEVIDISNPSSPTLVGSHSTGCAANDIEISGHFAYVANGAYFSTCTELQVFDIANPAIPAFVTSAELTSYAAGIKIIGSQAYIAMTNTGLSILDISNPAAPSETGYYQHQPGGFAVDAVGPYVYVAQYNEGLFIYRNTSIVASPILLSPINGAVKQVISPSLTWASYAGAASYRVQVSTTPGFGSVLIDDSTLTATSTSVGPLSSSTTYYWRVNARTASTTSPWSNVLSFNTQFVTSAEGNGSTTPVQFALEQNYPNPFNPSTTIRYALPQRSEVTLAVYNTLGQRVALLARGGQEMGRYEVKFDGSGLASGVYFYRIEAGPFVMTRKILLLR